MDAAMRRRGCSGGHIRGCRSACDATGVVTGVSWRLTEVFRGARGPASLLD